MGKLATPTPDIDLPGIVRRVRRILGVSQRGLAQRLEVSASTVARWETGAAEPAFSMFATMLDLAGLRHEVVDADQVHPAPMGGRDDVRDRRGRRFPAHLDVVATPIWDDLMWGRWAGEPRIAKSVNRRRSDIPPLAERLGFSPRPRLQLAPQHPTLQQVLEERGRQRESERAMVRARSRLLAERNTPAQSG
ncbi:helix-turn-helix domain-containing protein [Aestuariimicrobium ganziense]|uniref:helix-turn-helix domain-containing protein n=1 Tax=Aestuariimicrobium ganziense TaxID=2773677 RepID=UPI00194580F1|nr:helix-turn-helix domain-containing protein [Aestuariimicrobium ganziense]